MVCTVLVKLTTSVRTDLLLNTLSKSVKVVATLAEIKGGDRGNING